jgi:hypothetical protein
MMNEECGMMNEKQLSVTHHSAFLVHHFLALRPLCGLAPRLCGEGSLVTFNRNQL